MLFHVCLSMVWRPPTRLRWAHDRAGSPKCRFDVDFARLLIVRTLRANLRMRVYENFDAGYIALRLGECDVFVTAAEMYARAT